MKSIPLYLFLLINTIFFFSCHQSADTTSDSHASDNTAAKPEPVKPATTTSYLETYDGKYPREVNLLQDSILQPRLAKIAGEDFQFMKSTWATEVPMEVDNGMFKAEGCQAHNCHDTNFIIVVDISNDHLYAGIRKEGVVKIFSEDGSANNLVEEWSRRE